MKIKVRKTLIIVVVASFVIQLFPLDMVQAVSNYSNPIYENGIEDTYLFETTDSVVTTKTNLNRTKPQVFGKYAKEYYPSPNNHVNNEEQLANVLEESKEVMANVENDIKNGTLKKHIAADGQYGGTLSEDAKAVEKVVYVNTNLKGGHSLAVYAPAGEIVTITIPQEYLYLAEQGKMTLSVGLGYNADHVKNRMPRLGKSFVPTQTITKVGNPFGGMVYITFSTNTPDGLTIPVTVSGAVDTPYYDLGATTKQEWEQAKKAPGLYAELRTSYMRILVPSTEIRNIDDPYDALIFWQNVGALSTYSYGAQGRTLPITMIYDYYVFAGAAVATVGGWQCNFPTDWAKNALDYEGMTKSGGWGNLHEFNHHWQGTYNTNGRWGVGNPEEVTNNVMNAAEYILYTNIAAYRTESGYGDWKKVSDPYLNLKQTLNDAKGANEVTSVYMYTSFMHEFGVQNFLEVIKSNYSGGSYHGITLNRYNPEETREDDFAYRVSVVLGKDLSYYFKDVLHFPLSKKTIDKIKQLQFEEYIPVQNLYTAGVAGIETGRPYYIPNAEFVFDFNTYMATPAEFEIVSVSKPKYGTMTKNANGTYTYQSDASKPAGQIDEYDLTVKLKANGMTQTRVLKGKIGINYQTSKVETYEINENDTQKAITLSNTMLPYTTSYANGMNYKTENGYNFSKGTGYFTVPEDGEYEFQAYGDDKIRFITTVDGKEYISNTTTYTAGVSNAYQNKNCTHFTVTLEKGVGYAYTLYTNNRGGAGAGSVAYRKVGQTNWSNIPNNAIVMNLQDVGKNTDRSFSQPEIPYYSRSLKKIENKIRVDYSKASVISTPNKQNNDGNEASAILDWNRSTFFHSKYSGGNITPFPHEYIVDLGEEKEFNKIEIYTRANNTNGTIGDYKIYGSKDGITWNEIASDTNRKGNSQAPVTIANKVGKTKARYVKVSALNNKNGSNFTIISSLELSNEIELNDKMAQNSSKIVYEGNWTRKKDGNYINGATYNSNNGTMCYGFKGSKTAIYSAKDAIIQVKIDKGEWKQYNIKGEKYNPSLILREEEDKEHMVQIKVISGEFALNLLGTNGEFVTYHQEEVPEGLYITSNRYQIENSMITKISPKTDISEFRKQINTNAKIIQVLDQNNQVVTKGFVGTGMKLSLNNGEKILEIIVIGDINGDGKISVVDLVNIKKQLVGLVQLQGSKLKAADINGDARISVVDLVNIKKAIVGLITL